MREKIWSHRKCAGEGDELVHPKESWCGATCANCGKIDGCCWLHEREAEEELVWAEPDNSTIEPEPEIPEIEDAMSELERLRARLRELEDEE